MREQILDVIRTNRISSVEIADALDKSGVLSGLKPLNGGKYIAGEVYYTCTWSESNWPLHEQIQQIPSNSIIYVDAIGCDDRAIFGDIVAKWLMLYQKAAGIVVNGLLRDIHRLRKEGYPIWCTGVTPLGCYNHEVPRSSEIDIYIERQRRRFEGALLIADDSGCTLIEKEKVTNKFLERLQFLELQEDIWYFCTDTLKLSTFETICKKNYLSESELLPESLRKSLEQFEKDK